MMVNSLKECYKRGKKSLRKGVGKKKGREKHKSSEYRYILGLRNRIWILEKMVGYIVIISARPGLI